MKRELSIILMLEGGWTISTGVLTPPGSTTTRAFAGFIAKSYATRNISRQPTMLVAGIFIIVVVGVIFNGLTAVIGLARADRRLGSARLRRPGLPATTSNQ